METIKVQKNQIIAKQKEKVKAWYLILEGSVVQRNSYARIVLNKESVIGVSEKDRFLCDYIAREDSVGVMQITPILVAECNDILKRRKSKKRFTLADRFSIAKSKEMFLLIQSVHNPLNSIEHAIRAWNGGKHYSVKRTQRYFEKVMNLLKK